MFPIPFNIPFRKKDGSLSTLGDELNNGGGGSSYTLPTASADTKGGVKIGAGLTMDGEVLKNTNPTPPAPYVLPTASAEVLGGVKIGPSLEIVNGVIDKKGYNSVYGKLSATRPVFKSGTTTHKYNVAVVDKAINTSLPTVGYTLEEYNIDDVYLPELYDTFEFTEYVNESLISDLNLTELAAYTTDISSVELSDALTNYSALVIQGLYNNTGTSTYDTTVIYPNMELNKAYWFGVKDRNASYSGTITFTDNTHATLSASRKLKIYGIPKNV